MPTTVLRGISMQPPFAFFPASKSAAALRSPPERSFAAMYEALGIPSNDPNRAVARTALEKLLVIHGDEAYCQPCASPIWDSGLAANALLELGGEEAIRRAAQCCDWLKPKQILDGRGDWVAQRPNLRPGGWAFQYENAYYPDVDDTAVVVMAMDRLTRGQVPPGGEKYGESIARAREWIEGMQSKNGGWGAFDAENEHYYLNNIPFADHGALLDPPTEDVSARCVSMGKLLALSLVCTLAAAVLFQPALMGPPRVKAGHEAA